VLVSFTQRTPVRSAEWRVRNVERGEGNITTENTKNTEDGGPYYSRSLQITPDEDEGRGTRDEDEVGGLNRKERKDHKGDWPRLYRRLRLFAAVCSYSHHLQWLFGLCESHGVLCSRCEQRTPTGSRLRLRSFTMTRFVVLFRCQRAITRREQARFAGRRRPYTDHEYSTVEVCARGFFADEKGRHWAHLPAGL